MCFSSPKPKIPAAPQQETKVEQAVQESRDRERQRQRAALGASALSLTGGSGITTPATLGYKTLLGA